MRKERGSVSELKVGRPRPYLKCAERLLITLRHQLANADVVSQSSEPEVLDSLGSWCNAGSNRRVFLIVLREQRNVVSGNHKM